MKRARFRLVHKKNRTFVRLDKDGVLFEEDLAKVFSVYKNWFVCKICGEVLTGKTADELVSKIYAHEHDLTFIYKSTPKLKFRREAVGGQDNVDTI